MMTQSVAEFFEIIKHYQNIDDDFEPPSIVLPKLKAYQCRAIKWMIKKENNNDLFKSDGSTFSGGILADETGMGKSLEMLCCIVSNVSTLKLSDENIVHENLNYDTSNTSTSQKPLKKCEKSQNAEYLHFKSKPLQELPRLNDNCSNFNDKIPCKATLIIVPESILNNWILEIEIHIAKPGLKVLIYNGVKSDDYIQPITFNDYDVVIISYKTLIKDLKSLEYFDRYTSCLRNFKKYIHHQSPLLSVKWWRICIDKDQGLEVGTNKVFKIASCLESVHKWTLTGIPIQKSLDDLYGILKFLDISPYCDRNQFLQLIKKETSFVSKWFSKVIWRNSSKEVSSELVLPKITTENHWLKFTENEKYFYQNQRDYYALQFTNLVKSQLENIGITLKDIQNNTELVANLNYSIIRLRQTCLHPLALKERFLKIKGTMPMNKLIDTKLEECQEECSSVLYGLVFFLTHLVELHLKCEEPAIAAKYCRESLNKIEMYGKKSKIEILLKIQAMSNLVKILHEYSDVPSVSSDSDLEKNIKILEKEYLDIYIQKLDLTRKIVIIYLDNIEKLSNGRKLSCFNWWSDLLRTNFSVQDFLVKVQVELEDYCVASEPNIANILKTENDMINILNTWITDLNLARSETISKLNIVEKTNIFDLLQGAQKCHTNMIMNIEYSNFEETNTNSENQCLLCAAKSQLHLYRSLLFSIFDKQNDTFSNEFDVKYEETVNENACEDQWKMSQKEFLLTKLFQYEQAKTTFNDCFKDAHVLMKILSLVREEFIYLKELWIQLSEHASAHHDLYLNKNELWNRFKSKGLLQEDDEEGPPNKVAKLEKKSAVLLKKNDILEIKELSTSIPFIIMVLKKKSLVVSYLENKKRNSTDTEKCPVCTFDINFGCAVLLCGHSLCNACVVEMGNRSDDLHIKCPICRHEGHMNSLYFSTSNEKDEVPNRVIKGSFSTKVENVTIKLMELIEQDPNVKTLVFSAWSFALKDLGEALKLNSINYRVLKHKNEYYKTLKDFKTNTKINALLMELSICSKKLNLSEATRVIFMEPVLNKAEESIAIGQIYRLGQTKPCFVHHFILRDSIEENIINIFLRNHLDEWNNIKLSQMTALFESSQINPEPVSDNKL